MTDCLFCKIIAGDIPASIAYQDDQVVAFRDISPQAPVHVLIVPREHLDSLRDLTGDHGELLAAVATAADKIAVQEGIAESGYRVVTNVGPHAGQSVLHLHFHVVGGAPLGLSFGVPRRS